MLRIGDFARAGRVSVRMLRHYDQLGLLVPAHVDAWTGHRRYEPSQLERLDRIVTLNQLGFRLDELQPMLDDELAPAEFAGRLRERRDALQAQRDEIDARLAEVTRRLRLLDPTGEPTTQEKTMTTQPTIETLPALRVLQTSASVGSQPEIAPVIGPLFGRVYGEASRAGATPGLAFATYTWVDGEPGGRCDLTAGYVVGDWDGDVPDGLELVEHPACEAAVAVHHGSMERIHESWMALDRFVADSGLGFDGPCRELYLEASNSDQSTWVTQLQQPVSRA